jgi:hypothetical protein
MSNDGCKPSGNTSTFREFPKRRNDLNGFGQPIVYCYWPIRGLRKVSLKQLKTVDHHAFFRHQRISLGISNLETKLSARERSVKFVVRSDPEPDDRLSFAYTYGTI